MKLTDLISQVRADNKIEVKKAKQAEKPQVASEVSAGDRVEISDGTKDMQKMREIIAETPMERADLVATLKRQIESGEYQVPSQEVADKMLSSLFADEGILRN